MSGAKATQAVAPAIQAGMSVFDLEEMELAYSPQYGSAKDPINMAGSWRAGCYGANTRRWMWKRC